MKKTNVEQNKGILIVCALYAVISVMLFFLVTGGKYIESNDSDSYIKPALHILQDGFFSTDGINPEYSRTPGYPLFLALIFFVGGTVMGIIVIQMALMTLKVYLFYRILYILGTPVKYSLFGSAFLLINLQSYGYSFTIITESLFLFLIIVALYWLVRYLYGGRNHTYFLIFAVALN
jgi:4-amino-4-deoxy-L-arabinose transferase-like glycosyltransferase